MRTQEQIDKMIADLEKVRDKVPPKTGFGDSNTEALEAQIEVLQDDKSDDDIWEEWADNDHIREHAEYARKWLDGEDDPGDGEGLLSAWQSLVGVKVQKAEDVMAGLRAKQVSGNDEEDPEDDEDSEEEEDDWDFEEELA